MGSTAGKVCVVIGAAIVLGLAAIVPSAAAVDTLAVVSENFDGDAPSEFAGFSSIEDVQGYAGLGTGSDVFGGNFMRSASGETTLTLTDLPSHDAIDLGFLLAIIDSWDGDPCGGVGPDSLTVSVDGSAIFSEVFENSGCGAQSYEPPAGVELARHANLGFGGGGFFSDSAYDMGLDPTFSGIEHSASTLTITWSTGGVQQGIGDESWAMDNVEVVLHLVAEPGEEPTDTPSITPDDDPTVVPEVAAPEVRVLPRRLARTAGTQQMPWLLGIGAALVALGAGMYRVTRTRA